MQIKRWMTNLTITATVAGALFGVATAGARSADFATASPITLVTPTPVATMSPLPTPSTSPSPSSSPTIGATMTPQR